MRRWLRWVLILTVASWVVLSAPAARSAEGCGPSAPEALLFQSYTEQGTPAESPVSMVVPPDGARLPIDVGEPREIVAVPGTCRALVYTSAGKHVIVDGASLEMLSVKLEPGNDYRYMDGAGPLVLLTPGGVYDASQGVILNMLTGDVSPVVPEEVGFGSPVHDFSPTGKYLALTLSGGNAVLLPDGEWTNGQTLNTEGFAYVSAFDAEERRVLVQGSDLEDRRWLAIYEIASEEISVVAEVEESDAWLQGWFIPGRDEVLVSYGDRLALVDPRGDEPEELFSVSGSFSLVIPAASGEGALVFASREDRQEAANSTGEPPVSFLDLEQETVRPITELSETAPIHVEVGSRWVVLALGVGETPSELAVVDLESEQISMRFVVSDNDVLDLPSLKTSNDGQVTVVTATTQGNEQRVYMLNAESRKWILLADADRSSGAVAPSGNWVAYSTLDRTDDGRQMRMMVLDVATGSAFSVGSGLSPTWLSASGAGTAM